MVGRRFTVRFLTFLLLAQAALGQTAYKPHFKGDPAHSNGERSALGYMRTVSDPQKVRKKRHNKYATTLPALINTGSFTPGIAKTDRSDSTLASKRGPTLSSI